LHSDGATIVMVTHDQELAARAQREVHLVDGQILDLGARLGAQAAGPLNLQGGA
jgi:putative ABC transport system ATP-binding protein